MFRGDFLHTRSEHLDAWVEVRECGEPALAMPGHENPESMFGEPVESGSRCETELFFAVEDDGLTLTACEHFPLGSRGAWLFTIEEDAQRSRLFGVLETSGPCIQETCFP